MAKVYGEYEPETLKKMQSILLMMLRDFDTFCEKHGIDYFADAGTALGAVRHGGFIPWDDDIDIGMTRGDYDRFLALAPEGLSEKYRVLYAGNTPDYHVPSARLVLRGTVCYLENPKVDMGIFIDVSCFENVSDDDKITNREKRRLWFLGKLMILAGTGAPMIYTKGLKEKAVKLACAVIHGVFAAVRCKPQFFYRKMEKILRRHQNEDTRRIGWMFMTEPRGQIYDRTDIFPTRRMDFDGLQIRVANKPDSFLRELYGDDYMQLPPEDKRHNHKPEVLDFGPYG